jgi:peptidoglycan-associated lipoprotein
MSMNKLGKGLVVALSATVLFACAGKETATTAPVTAPVQTQPTVVAPPQPTPEELAIKANNEARQARTVYFDLDEDTVKPEGRDLLRAHAWFLSKPENAGVVVEIQGHCDERGTPAYNLALGERRAKAVAQILMLNGVQASQIKTVSHGEEMPAVNGHNESAWSKNRRGVVVYEG